MGLNLAVLPGDGVGAGVATEAPKVLEAVGEKFNHSLNFNARLVGGVAISTPGRPLRHETLCVVAEYAKAGLGTRIIINTPRPKGRG